MSGTWSQAYNDSHGTSVSGLVGGARDGNPVTNFHGVAFGASVYMGNTLKGDGALFGIPQATQTVGQTIDQDYIANTYRAVAAVPGVRIVGTSWGSQPTTEQYQTLLPTTGTNLTGRAGALGTWAYLTRGDTWFSGALDAWKTGAAINFSAGNTGYVNASPRAGAAYFRPELEARWTAVTGIQQTFNLNGTTVGTTYNPDGSVNIPGVQLYNQCGYAKWSCVAAPSVGTFSSNVTSIGGVSTAGTGGFSGTSAAQPHATAALGLIMERFSYMTNEQAISVMRTTALQNATINNAAGVQIINPTAGQLVQVPDDRNGWGTVSLRWAMNGPGQFMGNFAVNTQGQNDTWSNNISDVADPRPQGRGPGRSRHMGSAQGRERLERHAAASATAGADDGRRATGVLRQRRRQRLHRIHRRRGPRGGARRARLQRQPDEERRRHAGAERPEQLHRRHRAERRRAGGAFGHRVRYRQRHGDRRSPRRQHDHLRQPAELGRHRRSRRRQRLRHAQRARQLHPARAAACSTSTSVSAAGDLLDLAGTGLFGGGVDVSFASGLGIGAYTLISAHNYSGRFDSLTVTGLANGLTANLLYSAEGVQINVAAIPEPETYAMLMAGLLAVGWVARRRRSAESQGA